MGAMLCRIIYIPSAIAVIALVIIFGRQPLVLPPAGDMTPFTTDDKMLAMQHPANWKPHSNAVAGAATDMWFVPVRNAEIRVKADLAGSLMADISKGPAIDLGGTEGNNPRAAELQKEAAKRPLVTVHEMKGEELKKHFDEYEEASAEDTTIDGMQALSTSFTFKKAGLWGKKEMAGRRMSAIASDRRITVLYFYPKELDGTLEPIYKKMLATFKYTSI